MNIDKSLKKMLGSNKKNSSNMPKMNINIPKFNMKQFGINRPSKKRDWDMDGVTNRKDCQPRNPMRQDSMPNRMVRERIKKLPIYYAKNVEKGEGEHFDVQGSHIYYKAPKSAVQFFHRAVKQQPEILSDIERTKSEVFLYGEKNWAKLPKNDRASSRDIDESAGHAEPVYEDGKLKGTMIGIKLRSTTMPSLVLSHELRHAQQHEHMSLEDASNRKVAVTSEEYSKDEQEIDAEMYATRKLFEAKNVPAIEKRMEHIEKIHREEEFDEEQSKQEVDEESKRELAERKEKNLETYRQTMEQPEQIEYEEEAEEQEEQEEE